LQMSSRSNDKESYSIPVLDRPNNQTLSSQWRIRDQDKNRVVLEPIYMGDENVKYSKQPLELYTSRLSLSYNNIRPSDRYSTSYKPLTPTKDKSLGWRVWSRVETQRVTSPSTGASSFDRTYSRNYQRPYARPYNVDPVIPVASYSSAYTKGDSDRYSVAGTYQSIPRRPNRDYSSKIGGSTGNSFQVKSYHRNVTTYGRK